MFSGPVTSSHQLRSNLVPTSRPRARHTREIFNPNKLQNPAEAATLSSQKGLRGNERCPQAEDKEGRRRYLRDKSGVSPDTKTQPPRRRHTLCTQTHTRRTRFRVRAGWFPRIYPWQSPHGETGHPAAESQNIRPGPRPSRQASRLGADGDAGGGEEGECSVGPGAYPQRHNRARVGRANSHSFQRGDRGR